MSWQIFKDNILRAANSPEGIGSLDSIAELYASEYDAAIKRGGDTINHIPLMKGNTDAMKQLFKAAFQQGMNSTGPYDLVGNMGNGVLAYWQGAELNKSPIPLIPAVGSVINVSITSAICTTPGQWQPAAPSAIAQENPYSKLDWSSIPLDKNDPIVQDIINPNVDKINQKISNDEYVLDDKEGGSSRVSQLDNTKAEILDKALHDQGIIKPSTISDTDLKSGYKNLDELLKIAGAWTSKLGKNPRVKYENLKQGYIAGIHGLCPQGTQSVVVALTGIRGLGVLSGNADWFSFKNPSTGGGRSSFAVPIGGKVYYNDKVHIDNSYTLNPSQWQVGDIVVMGYTGDAPYGHIQVWTGWKWVSDFSQNKIQSNHVDAQSIAMWRLNDNGKQAIQSNKSSTV